MLLVKATAEAPLRLLGFQPGSQDGGRGFGSLFSELPFPYRDDDAPVALARELLTVLTCRMRTRSTGMHAPTMLTATSVMSQMTSSTPTSVDCSQQRVDSRKGKESVYLQPSGSERVGSLTVLTMAAIPAL